MGPMGLHHLIGGKTTLGNSQWCFDQQYFCFLKQNALFFVLSSDRIYLQKIRPHNLAPPLSAATAAVIMGSAELAMLPSSPSFAATISGAFNPQILVVDVRKSSTDQTEANGEGFE